MCFINLESFTIDLNVGFIPPENHINNIRRIQIEIAAMENLAWEF
jgi:hypothetical protein